VNEKKPGDAGAKDGAADGVAARETQQPKATEPPAPPAAPPLSPQARAMIELAKQPGAEAEKALVAGLASGDAETRSAAAVALTKRGMSVVPALIEVLEKGSAQAKKEAHFALREITHESLPLDARKWDEWWKSRQDTKPGPAASNSK
jgi:HEAT repeat protein